METHHQIRKKADRIFFGKILFSLISVICGTLFLKTVLSEILLEESIQKYEDTAGSLLDETKKSYLYKQTYAENLANTYHEGSQAITKNLAGYIEKNARFTFTDQRAADELLDFSDSFLIAGYEENGTVLFSSCASGVDLDSYVTKENFDLLKECTGDFIYAAGEEFGQYLYSTKCRAEGRDFVLVAGFDADILLGQIREVADLDSLISDAAAGSSVELCVLDKTDQTVAYFDDDEETEITGKAISETGLSEAVLEDGYAGKQTFCGDEYYVLSRELDDELVLLSAVKTAELRQSDRYIRFWSVSGFVLIMLLCLVYAVIVRNDFVRNRTVTETKEVSQGKTESKYFNLSVFRKVFPLMLSGAFLIGCLSFYTQTLAEVSRAIRNSRQVLEGVTLRYEDRSIGNESTRQFYSRRYTYPAKIIAAMFEADPTVLNEDSERIYTVFNKEGERVPVKDDEGNPLKTVWSSKELQELCSVNTLASIQIFDEDGRTIAANNEEGFYIAEREGDEVVQAYQKVLAGELDFYMEDLEYKPEDNLTYALCGFSYCTAKDAEGKTVYLPLEEYRTDEHGQYGEITTHRSMLRIGLYSSILNYLLPEDNLDVILKSDILSNGFVMLFDPEEGHKCIYSNYDEHIGRTAAQLDISETAFNVQDYYGFSRFNGGRYFMVFRHYKYLEDYYIATAIPCQYMYRARLRIAMITSLFSLVIILILVLLAGFTNREEEILFESSTEPRNRLDRVIFNIILPSGRKAATMTAAARWDNRRIPWRERTPEQKLLFLVTMGGAGVILYVIIMSMIYRRLPSEISIMSYIIGGQWDKGLNVFALTACGMTAVFACAIITIVRIPLLALRTMFGTRGETVSHLVLSFIRYGICIGSIFFSLYLLGVDAAGLLASAGLLTLIIGLGAQSLVKDILAGLFIVFEGEFRVGDIVTINSYRGTVADIGLRTTKIMGFDGNVKIFANSEISGVLNMTKSESFAGSSITIEYGQDLEYVEAVFNRELPKLKEENENIVIGPNYGGVSQLGESGYTIAVSCRCEEKNVFGVTRFLNRALLRICEKNNIRVAYPHMKIVNDEEK